MATRKAAPDIQLQQQEPVCPMPTAKKVVQPRPLSEVVPEIQRLRNEGLTVPQICEGLDVTYHVVNQVITQSYKMSMDTAAVFERQERMRLGLDVA